VSAPSTESEHAAEHGGRTEVDLLLVGVGPVGLYGAYYAGFRGLSVAVMDSLPEVGGQVAALYPEKALYDIAGFPSVRGQQLVDNLVAQAAPFQPTYLVGHQAATVERNGDRLIVTSATNHVVDAGAVVITGGVGTVSPRQLPAGEDFLDRGLSYFVPKLDVMSGKDVVVVGGGDSAVDWALALTEGEFPIAKSVTLVHRRARFRAHQHSVDRLMESPVRIVVDAEVSAVLGEDTVTGVEITTKGNDTPEHLPAQAVVAALGFRMQLGPLEEWGLELDNRSIVVDSSMRTNVEGIFAAGDITTYPGKVKLIAVGFGEVATAVNNAAAVLQPDVGLAPGHSSDAPPPALATAS
jgi:ferredoxin/flavodoxin---NADP+ reductase